MSGRFLVTCPKAVLLEFSPEPQTVKRRKAPVWLDVKIKGAIALGASLVRRRMRAGPNGVPLGACRRQAEVAYLRTAPFRPEISFNLRCTRSTVDALHLPPLAVAIRRSFNARAMAFADMSPRLSRIERVCSRRKAIGFRLCGGGCF